MTKQLENTMIREPSVELRELSTDELLMVAGGQRMEVDASRYTAPVVTNIDWGWIRGQYNHTNGSWLATIGHGANRVNIGGIPGETWTS